VQSFANPELDSLDENGERIIAFVEYEPGYIPVYSSARDYQPLITTHTPGGWYIQQDATIRGFRDGTHHILERVNIDGKGLILIPSAEAYGPQGSGIIPPNTVVLFEIIPIEIR
jgi:hypothetical protein